MSKPYILEEAMDIRHRKCKCGGTIEIHVAKEPNQKKGPFWSVEYCDGCDYWKAGWVKK